MRNFLRAVTIAVLLAGCVFAQDTPVYFAPDPGPAQADVRQDGFAIWNRAVGISVLVTSGRLAWLEFQDRIISGTPPERLTPFVLLLSDGSGLTASEMKMVLAPKQVELGAQEDASR